MVSITKYVEKELEQSKDSSAKNFTFPMESLSLDQAIGAGIWLMYSYVYAESIEGRFMPPSTGFQLNDQPPQFTAGEIPGVGLENVPNFRIDTAKNVIEVNFPNQPSIYTMSHVGLPTLVNQCLKKPEKTRSSALDGTEREVYSVGYQKKAGNAALHMALMQFLLVSHGYDDRALKLVEKEGGGYACIVESSAFEAVKAAELGQSPDLPKR